jgi:hypothetical protein
VTADPRRGPDPRGAARAGRPRARLRLDAATTAVAGLLRRLRRRPPAIEWTPALRVLCHEAPENLRAHFVATGFESSHFLPHRVHRLPKPGPDGYRLARRMCGVRDPDRLWQLVLFASPTAVDEFPREMFFDPDLFWHQQHFHEVGQIASADLVAVGRRLHTMAHHSDLMQRMSLRRDFEARVGEGLLRLASPAAQCHPRLRRRPPLPRGARANVAPSHGAHRPGDRAA